MSKRKTWVWIAVCSAVVLAGSGVAGLRALGPRVSSVRPLRREIVQTVIVSGRVLPPSRISVGSMVAGVVRSIAVKEGDHVQAGELLVQLDDTEAQAAVAAARAGLQQARARLRQLKHITGPVARQVHLQADANLELARLSFERQVALARKGSTPVAQLDESRRALAIAQSQHDATEAQAHGSGPRGAEHALALAAYAQAAASVAQAEARAAQARITAATAATVLTRAVEPGELVQPGRAMLVLARDGETLLTVQPDEKNLAELRLNQPARASADAFPDQHFAAVVSYIAPSVDPQRGTIEVRFTVADPPAYLRPDMTVSVNIEVGRKPAALVVPKEAVQELGVQRSWVFVLRGRHVEKRGVELGLRDERLIELRSGLGEDEQVVLPGGAALASGQRVRASAGG